MRASKSFSRDQRGSVLIEFAMLGPVFFMLVMGLAEIVLYQYRAFALNHVVYEATRNLQTGEVQTSANLRAMFDQLCQESAGPLMNCSQVSWDVRAFDAIKDITYPPPAFDANGSPTNFVFQPGAPNQYSVVRATLQYKFVTPFLDQLFRMGPNLPAIINGYAIVKNEPWA